MHKCRRLVSRVIPWILASILFGAQLTPARAVGRAYYVDSQAPCPGAGTPSSPWCDFTFVNRLTFAPGDRLLLARGSEWNQQLILRGRGSQGDPIVLAAYGDPTLPRPRIIRNGPPDNAVWMWAPSFWSVGDLELGNAQSGLVASYHLGQPIGEGLLFHDLFVHHIRGAFLQPFECEDPSDPSPQSVVNAVGIGIIGCPALVRDVSLVNIEGAHNQTTIGTIFAVIDLFIKGLHIHDDDGSAPEGASGKSCYASIALAGAVNATIIDSVIEGGAACYTATGTSAVLLVRSQDVNIVNSIIAGTPRTESPDETGLDYEWMNQRVRLLANVFTANYGNAVEFMAWRYPPGPGGGEQRVDVQADHEVAQNTFVWNGVATEKGAIHGIGETTRPVGTIADNIFLEPAGFATQVGATFEGFRFRRNVVVDATEPFWSASWHYSPTTQGENGFAYQYQIGRSGAWRDLSPGSDGVWFAPDAPGVRIGRSFQHPGDCPLQTPCDVARGWTATRPGSISIRGRVLSSDASCGDGVVARITRSRGSAMTVLWPGPEGELIAAEPHPRQGAPTDLDDVPVEPGDVIRFETSMNESSDCDETSWAPTIVYTDQRTYDWGWNVDGKIEAWAPVTRETLLTVADGKLHLESAGSQPPRAVSPDYLGLDGLANRWLLMGITNPGEATVTGRIWFRTQIDIWQTVTFKVEPGTSTVRVDMHASPAWIAAPVRRLQVEVPVPRDTRASLDFLRLAKA